MSDKIIDLGARRASLQLRDTHAIMLRCNNILDNAIEGMGKFANRRHILRTLYRAVANLEYED